MDKNIKTYYTTYLSRILFLTTCLISFSANAFADNRNEAREAVLKLRQTINSQKMPDELASIETTYSVAEQYFKQKNLELSEQYYLLTIQKARILNTSPIEKPALYAKINIPNINILQHPIEKTTDIPLPLAQITPKPDSNNSILPTSVDSTLQAPIAEISSVKEDKTTAAKFIEKEQDGFLAGTVSSEFMVGNPSIYFVTKHDNIRLVAAKLGVSRQHLIETNKLNAKSILKVGQQIKYNNRRIIPHQIKNGIVINIPEKTLYFFKGGKLSKTIPVALGVATKTKKFDWKTPTGKFKIIAKQKDPTWYVPPSIQEEMEDDGKEVITSIPPGPTNPLGKYAVKTTLPGILIHSTIRPASIGSFASHGCIRVYPQHMEEFFNEVKVNTPGEIIYRPVKLANTESGRIFLEVHHDEYGKSAELTLVARQLIEKQNLSDRVDWKKVKNVIKLKAGIAEDISL